jgi:3-hydroxyisobutyrate dehydrogenase-like beta-hydroxyacid dehydrogenase
MGAAARDIRLALDAAPDRRLAVLEAIHARWQRLAEQGFGAPDMSAARHGLERPAAPAPPP